MHGDRDRQGLLGRKSQPRTDHIPLKHRRSDTAYNIGRKLTCAQTPAVSQLNLAHTHTHTHAHPFNGPFSRTTWVSRYQKGKTNLDFTEARDGEWQWHQLGHMKVCTLLQTDNHKQKKNKKKQKR